MNVYVWDDNLELAGIIMRYASLIWAERHIQTGDCELYLPASVEMIALLQKDYFLTIDDSDMVCVIRKIELKTDAEKGDYLIVTGYDVKCLAYQRVLFRTYTNTGSVEAFLHSMVYDCMVYDASYPSRKFIKDNMGALVTIEALQGLSGDSKEQVSYKNLGDEIVEICTAMQWGWRFRMISVSETVRQLQFQLYQGTDRSAYVIFQPDYYNLTGSDYTDDLTSVNNAVLVGGAGNGSDRALVEVVASESNNGIDRYEKFLDDRNAQTQLKYSELKAIFPLASQGGSGSIAQAPDGSWRYYLTNYVFVVQPGDFETWLSSWFGYQVSFYTTDNVRYCRLNVGEAAILPNSTPSDNDTCTLEKFPQVLLLSGNGATEIASEDNAEKLTFSGNIVPDMTFKYGEDFFVGDLVTVKNGYGITSVVRVTEAVRVWDEKGYQLQIKYENK